MAHGFAIQPRNKSHQNFSCVWNGLGQHQVLQWRLGDKLTNLFQTIWLTLHCRRFFDVKHEHQLFFTSAVKSQWCTSRWLDRSAFAAEHFRKESATARLSVRCWNFKAEGVKRDAPTLPLTNSLETETPAVSSVMRLTYSCAFPSQHLGEKSAADCRSASLDGNLAEVA